MERVNWLRMIVGGLLAGVVVNVCEFVANCVILKDRWAVALNALGRPAVRCAACESAAFLIWGFLVGIFAIWFYVAIRSHYGAGPKTAVIAGVAVWVLGYLLAAIPPAAMHLFGRRLLLGRVAAGLVGTVVGSLLGAWLYKAPGSSGATSPRP